MPVPHPTARTSHPRPPGRTRRRTSCRRVRGHPAALRRRAPGAARNVTSSSRCPHDQLSTTHCGRGASGITSTGWNRCTAAPESAGVAVTVVRTASVRLATRCAVDTSCGTGEAGDQLPSQRRSRAREHLVGASCSTSHPRRPPASVVTRPFSSGRRPLAGAATPRCVPARAAELGEPVAHGADRQSEQSPVSARRRARRHLAPRSTPRRSATWRSLGAVRTSPHRAVLQLDRRTRRRDCTTCRTSAVTADPSARSPNPRKLALGSTGALGSSSRPTATRRHRSRIGLRDGGRAACVGHRPRPVVGVVVRRGLAAVLFGHFTT